MTASRIQFSWADAWILLSIVCASRRSGTATLRDIIAMADGINHAILTHGEADEGLARLIAAGYVSREGADFRPAEAVITAYKVFSKRDPMVRLQTKMEEFLGATPWTAEYQPPADGSGRMISREDFDAAVNRHLGRPE